MMSYQRVTISLDKDHVTFVRESSLSLSKVVRRTLDNLMSEKKEGQSLRGSKPSLNLGKENLT